jgi:hypothetical protein
MVDRLFQRQVFFNSRKSHTTVFSRYLIPRPDAEVEGGLITC